MNKKLKIAISLNLDLCLARYTLMYQGIQEYAKQHTDWSLYWDHFPEIKLRKCKTGAPAYDGIIGRIKHSAYDEAKRHDLPCVNLWYNSDLTQEIPSVLGDFRKIGQLAAKHMLSRGFKNITMIDFYDNSSNDFLEGLYDILKPMKYKVKRYRFNRTAADSPAAWEKQMEAFDKWVKDWEFPMAIVSSANIIAIPTYCKANGIKIPEDIAFLMSGIEDALCETIEPYITSIDTSYRRHGYEAAKMLHQQLNGEELEERLVYIEPRGVIPRASTDTYATEDRVVRDALRFITDNIGHEIQVGDVVRHVAVSRSALESRFKAATQSTIKDEINRLRVISVKRLLSDEKIKIKDVHAKAGFSSALHLRRVFSKLTGMTPGEFRKSLSTN